MKTLKEIIQSKKVRIGKSAGIGSRGAFWSVGPGLKLSRYGGDGIGQSDSDTSEILEFRHYRNGELIATIAVDSYHQNGSSKTYFDVTPILDCRTIEDIIRMLQPQSRENFHGSDDFNFHGLNDFNSAAFIEIFKSWGMPEALPSPGEPAI